MEKVKDHFLDIFIVASILLLAIYGVWYVVLPIYILGYIFLESIDTDSETLTLVFKNPFRERK